MTHPTMIDLSLVLVTDDRLMGADKFTRIIGSAISGGVTCVQLRHKTAPDLEFLELGIVVRDMCSKAGIALIINDRVDIAQLVGADGVHLGRGDIPAVSARRLLPANSIVGISLEAGQTELPIAGSFDYIGVSPLFVTETKPELENGWGLEGLRALRVSHHEPLVAIGGISVDNASGVMEAGADGLAVVSAICRARDPERAASTLREIVEKHRKPRNN